MPRADPRRRRTASRSSSLVELKARFDEERNIAWARKLEQAGVHVVYGLVGLKTHAKVALVVRHEPDGIRRYCHLGTGNYNAADRARSTRTSALFTADPALGADVGDLFNHLTGYSRQRSLSEAAASRRRALRDGDPRAASSARSSTRAPAGRPHRDQAEQPRRPALIDALYAASQAGVEIDLDRARHLLPAAGRARA